MKIFSALFALVVADHETAKCNLFEVNCSIDGGWTLTVNETCHDEQYKNLKIKDQISSFFMINRPIQNVTTTPPVDPKCRFTATDYPRVITNLTFNSCEGFPFTADPKADHTEYTGYVDQRIFLPPGNISASEMDEIKVKCELDNADLKADDAPISAPDEPDSVETLSSDDLIKEFDLGLQVGTIANGNFEPLPAGQEVDVGSRIGTKLTKKNTDYEFQLKGCNGYATIDDKTVRVEFYTTKDDYCPNKTVKTIINFVWEGFELFTLDVFRIANADKLTFACEVTVFNPGTAARIDCDDDSRRRRSAEESVTSFEITKTINLAKENESSALQTCANILVPSVFFLAFL